ncbi:hypothetical protein M3223_10490 [Paenibacillus pasadenensis]|uniref:hypothetical protein n=1 Tax=Paenibacillus pasadenensis TaxID=217090 RepID=UPI00203C68A5|nr:hypothetical protein [Paenibacillus pasadenensis]MCM3747785.1 hypothetical protein [Paenibacillus pasadenensis]
MLAIMSLLSACSNDGLNTAASPKPSKKLVQKEQTIEAYNEKAENNERNNEASPQPFSYLKQLPVEKQEAVTLFTTERSPSSFSNFSPEDMVLVYLYFISIGDPDLIYEITYNGGYLPDKETFRKDYFEYVLNHDSETAVHYRYFDSIKVDENTAEENKVSVHITVSIEATSHSLVLGLQKENQLWKLVTYHLMKEFKSRASKSRA